MCRLKIFCCSSVARKIHTFALASDFSADGGSDMIWIGWIRIATLTNWSLLQCLFSSEHRPENSLLFFIGFIGTYLQRCLQTTSSGDDTEPSCTGEWCVSATCVPSHIIILCFLNLLSVPIESLPRFDSRAAAARACGLFKLQDATLTPACRAGALAAVLDFGVNGRHPDGLSDLWRGTHRGVSEPANNPSGG